MYYYTNKTDYSNYEDMLTPIISQLGLATSSVINEIKNPSKIPLDKLMEALDTDPVAYACCQIKAARVIQLMSVDYTHTNEKIDSFIKSNFENCSTNIADLSGKLASAIPLGMSLAEVSFKHWKLDNINVLNPNQVSFNIRKGNIENIEYNDGGIEKSLPLWKTLHVTNGGISNFGSKLVFGSPEMRRAYPYIRLKQLLFGEIGITAKRLATGFLVGMVDSNLDTLLVDDKNQPELDENGKAKRITAAQQMAKQLAKLENNGYVIIDKRNSLQAQGVPAGEQFWNLVSSMIDSQLMRCFVTPDTIFQSGVASFGVGGLANMQLNILDSSVQEVVKKIQGQLIEKAIKPLIYFNFGKQPNYGKFSSSEINDPNKEAMKIQNLITLMSMQIIPNDDINALNLLREYIGLPKITEENMKIEKEVNNQLQAMENQLASKAQTENNTVYPEDFTQNVQTQVQS
jgi:hypothetical protein